MTDYPQAEYPTIVSGVIKGPRIRCESLDGSVLDLSRGSALQIIPGLVCNADSFLLSACGPFSYGDRIWGVTHLQKYSTWGWLKVAPDCYHRWWFWKLQEQDAQGNWLPGTERGLYFRKPFSWRWDVAGTLVDGVLRHWIWTRGYLGGHWD